MKSGNVVEICLWTHLAVKGLSGYQAFDTLSLAFHSRRVSNLLKIILIYEEQYINIKDKM